VSRIQEESGFDISWIQRACAFDITNTETLMESYRLRSYGSRSYEPGTLPVGLAPKVHRRIGDRGLERCETLDSRNCETPNPDNSFPVGKLYTVHGEAVKEGRKDLWTGSGI
jgi:hypothetical protein